jgi:hypothetical protein
VQNDPPFDALFAGAQPDGSALDQLARGLGDGSHLVLGYGTFQQHRFPLPLKVRRKLRQLSLDSASRLQVWRVSAGETVQPSSLSSSDGNTCRSRGANGDDAHDLATQTAYAFRKVQTGLACWSWCDVRSYGEAGRLLAAVVDLSAPLNPLIACQLIRRRLAGRPCCMLSTCRGTLRSGSRPSVPTEAQDGVSSSVCARIRTQSSRSPFRSRATRSRNQTRRQRVPGAGACKAPDGPTGLPQQKTLA